MSNPTLTVPECIAIIKAIENEYRTWTTVQIIDNIRHISPLDSASFQLLYGSDAGVSFNPKGTYTKENRDDLIATLSHDYDKNNNNNEIGISLDTNSSRWVALGHVLTGISAAIYHDKLLTWSQKWQPIRTSAIKTPALGPIPSFELIPALGPYVDLPINFGIFAQDAGVDSLYAATIAGDLGQTVTGDYKLWTSTTYDSSRGGVGTEASAAELYGDIDGFWLGLWLRGKASGQAVRQRMRLPMTDINNVKLSTFLGEYYGIIKPQDKKLKMSIDFLNKITKKTVTSSLQSNLRFTNFLTLLRNNTFRNNLLLQTKVFQARYAQFSAKSIDPKAAVASYVAFERWCFQQVVILKAAAVKSGETGYPFSDCIDDDVEPIYLDLDGSLMCEFVNDGDLKAPKVDTVLADLKNRDWLSDDIYTIG
jgi:hypothetical protein